MKNLLRVSEIDWQKAKLFFRAHKNDVFMENGTSGVQYDFIKIEDTIYAINMQAYLGTGGFGKVRVGEKEDGENVAIKIEPRGLKRSDIYENNILAEIGMFKGMLERTTEKSISMRLGPETILTDKIVYRVIELIPGEDLSSLIIRQVFSEKQKYIVAMQAIIALKELHDKKILHRDIKGANIKVVIDSQENISLRILDFGFAYKLIQDEVIKLSRARMGTEGFMAPEITNCDRENAAVYSFQSDIFAMGALFQRLGLPEQIYKPMKRSAPHRRPSHEKILKMLISSFQTYELTKTDQKLIDNVSARFNLEISEQTKTCCQARKTDVHVRIPAVKPPPLEVVSSNTLDLITQLVREKLLQEIAPASKKQQKPIQKKQAPKMPLKAAVKLQPPSPPQPPIALAPLVTAPQPSPTSGPAALIKKPFAPQFHMNVDKKKVIQPGEIQQQFMRVVKQVNTMS